MGFSEFCTLQFHWSSQRDDFLLSYNYFSLFLPVRLLLCLNFMQMLLPLTFDRFNFGILTFPEQLSSPVWDFQDLLLWCHSCHYRPHCAGSGYRAPPPVPCICNIYFDRTTLKTPSIKISRMKIKEYTNYYN